MTMIKKLMLLGAALLLAGCSGFQATDKTFTAHAESFNILFFQIPSEDTQNRAMALVPEGAEIETIYSTPDDLTSVFGVLPRILGVSHTTVNGQLAEPTQ